MADKIKDNSAIRDSVEAVLHQASTPREVATGEDVKGPDPEVWAWRDELKAQEREDAVLRYIEENDIQSEVKGPDPEVWG